MHLFILMSRCESSKITAILPMCALPFPITFATYYPKNNIWDLYAEVRILVYDLSFIFAPVAFESCRFHLISSSLHTATVNFFTFAVTLHFLVHSSAFPICFCNPAGVSDVPAKSSANIKIPTPYLPPPWLPVWQLRLLVSCHKYVPWVHWVLTYIPV